MHLETLRLSTGPKTTIGGFFINGRFECYTIEDTQRFIKIPGDTRIPSGGPWKVELRDVGRVTKKYRSRFPDMHNGMLWVRGVPGFKWVYIHIGNNEDDTEGCILVGDDPNNNRIKDGFVAQSTQAYRRIYPVICDAIQTEGVTLSVRNYG